MAELSEKHIDLLAREYIEVGAASTYEGLATELRNRAGNAFAAKQDIQAKFYRDLADEMVARGVECRKRQSLARIQLEAVEREVDDDETVIRQRMSNE